MKKELELRIIRDTEHRDLPFDYEILDMKHHVLRTGKSTDMNDLLADVESLFSDIMSEVNEDED